MIVIYMITIIYITKKIFFLNPIVLLQELSMNYLFLLFLISLL
jgi:hypothetical protein